MLEIRNIVLELDEEISTLRKKIQSILKTKDFQYEIKKESLDARKRNGKRQIRFLYQVSVQLADGMDEKKYLSIPNVSFYEEENLDFIQGNKPVRGEGRPIVVGFGPAGIFASYVLAKYAYRPIVIERGEAVEERQKTIDRFWQGGPLNSESNVQFGEGGAGTFSDGKLTSRSKDPWTREVKRIFIEHGAPKDILYSHESHIGTDLLRDIIIRIRKQIIAWGGEIHFSCKMERLVYQEDQNCALVETNKGNFLGPVFLGIGHSSRDSFRMLAKENFSGEPKPFAIGFRIEHPQSLINEARYGEYANHPRLGAASYQVRSSLDEDGKNCYSFCMCPGGHVIQASSVEEMLVTNGMSYHARDGKFANSAILTSVRPGEDYGSALLDGIAFQEAIEAKAYILGGKNNFAPVQKVEDFIAAVLEDSALIGDKEKILPETSFTPGTVLGNLDSIYSKKINTVIAKGLLEIDRQIPGFAGKEANFIGVETRSSSPIRWLREKESRQAEGREGVYPIGEGAGYAGGIISAALDGLRSAEAFMREFAASKE